MKFMQLIIRSMKNVFRKKSRSILTCIVLVIICVFVLVGLSIKAGTEASITDTRKRLASQVTLGVNTAKIMEDAEKARQEQQDSDEGTTKPFSNFLNMGNITETVADTLANSNYIEGYDYKYSGSLMSTLENIQIDDSAQGGMGMRMGGSQSMTDDSGVTWNPFTGEGNRYADLSTDFYSGNYILADTNGDFYTIDDVDSGALVCLIDSKIADLNGLAVGDSIKVKGLSTKMNMSFSPPQDGGGDGSTSSRGQKQEMAAATQSVSEAVELKIVGIYNSTSTTDTAAGPIYMPYSTLRTLMQSVPEDTTDDTATTETSTDETEETPTDIINSAVFYLNDPDEADAFIAEAETNGLDMDAYTLSKVNESTVTSAIANLQNVGSFADMMILVVLIAGAVIIMLIMTLNARERKGEIGILRALGAKRGKIAMQFILETVAICLIAIVIGGGAGILTSQKVADVMMNNQIKSEEQQEQESLQNAGFEMPGGGGPGGNTTGDSQVRTRGGMGGGPTLSRFGGGDSTQVKAVTAVSSTTGIMQVLELVGAALIISLLGSLAAAYWVMKVEPMTILSSRE